MLSHALYENGILDLSELTTYVHDDVERNVHRLDDLNRRLQTSYQELLSVIYHHGNQTYLIGK